MSLRAQGWATPVCTPAANLNFSTNGTIDASTPGMVPFGGGWKLSNRTIYVRANRTLTIADNIVFEKCAFSMGTNTTLVVAAGKRLTLDNSWLGNCGGFAWNGVTLTAGAGFVTQNQSEILETKIAALQPTNVLSMDRRCGW
jgi:hypothetical protein